MPWDLFCRVVDNFGDIGVCWRLAAQLAGRGQPVRLWTDDARALRWMAPEHESDHPLVSVVDWQRAAAADVAPGEVVIEAFGCDPPEPFIARMASAVRTGARQPLWINLEYLSAERHAERNHLLPSPQSAGVGAGLIKYFFFPGFSEASGGLLRETDLFDRQRAFRRVDWLAARGIRLRPGEQVFSLFCYPDAPLADLLDQLATRADRPTLLLATAGSASERLTQQLGGALQRGPLRAVTLPWLSQPDYDHLLWSCDINWVRGEDSAVRAQWAGRPFVWQLYVQPDGADRIKANAFLERFFGPAMPAPAGELAAGVTRLWQLWNGWPVDRRVWPGLLFDRTDWHRHCLAWRDHLSAQSDLLSRLQAFVEEAR